MRSRALIVLDDLAGGDGAQVPVGVVDDGLHELVGDPHRVVGVLVLDRVAVLAVEVHVEAGVAQHARLALLDGLAPDELLDVGVVDVEDDHLRGAAGLAPGLDRAGRRVGAAHEADRARRPCRRPSAARATSGCFDRLMPEPEPPLKIVPSSTYQLRIESIVSSTARMKHALACCGTPCTPMLNQTGELNAAFWVTMRCLSSARNASASASSTK